MTKNPHRLNFMYNLLLGFS